MASFNRISIVGYAGKDCELKYTGSGTAIAAFSIATTEKRKGRDGNQEESTTWFRVSCFGRLAEIAGEYIKKGTMLYVAGKLRQESFTDREGNQRNSLEVTGDDIQLLGSKGERSDAPQSAKAAAVDAGWSEPGGKLKVGQQPAPTNAEVYEGSNLPRVNREADIDFEPPF